MVPLQFILIALWVIVSLAILLHGLMKK